MTHPAHAIAAYCAFKDYPFETTPGHLNIVYIEGLNPDFTPNNDRADEWNDLRIVVDHKPDTLAPFIAFVQVATTEPGHRSTHSVAAKKSGGVARVAFRHYPRKWVHGFHNVMKNKYTHPALIQKRDEPIMVHRDLNKDGKRTGDNMAPAWGINQHGTSPKASPKQVGGYSAGCLVGLDWDQHLEFLELLKTDPRYIANNNFAYSATIIAGDDFLKFRIDAA